MVVPNNQGFPTVLKMIILGCFGGTTILGNTHMDSLEMPLEIHWLPSGKFQEFCSPQNSDCAQKSADDGSGWKQNPWVPRHPGSPPEKVWIKDTFSGGGPACLGFF